MLINGQFYRGIVTVATLK